MTLDKVLKEWREGLYDGWFRVPLVEVPSSTPWNAFLHAEIEGGSWLLHLPLREPFIFQTGITLDQAKTLADIELQKLGYMLMGIDPETDQRIQNLLLLT